MPDQGQLTVLPICQVCRKTQLTNEELAIAKDKGTQPRCWYCLVDALVQIQSEQSIPDPTEYGRPGETKEHGIQLSKEKLFRPINVKDAISQMNQNLASPPTPATAATPAAGQSIKPVLPMSGAGAIPFTDAERKEYILKFGADPTPRNTPYEIIVHGQHEDLYLKFSCPVQVDLSYERELKRIMGGVVDVFGKLMKYGPSFAATLIELQNTSSDMFLGSK
jgi:hypothetical protein